MIKPEQEWLFPDMQPSESEIKENAQRLYNKAREIIFQHSCLDFDTFQTEPFNSYDFEFNPLPNEPRSIRVSLIQNPGNPRDFFIEALFGNDKLLEDIKNKILSDFQSNGLTISKLITSERYNQRQLDLIQISKIKNPEDSATFYNQVVSRVLTAILKNYKSKSIKDLEVSVSQYTKDPKTFYVKTPKLKGKNLLRLNLILDELAGELLYYGLTLTDKNET